MEKFNFLIPFVQLMAALSFAPTFAPILLKTFKDVLNKLGNQSKESVKSDLSKLFKKIDFIFKENTKNFLERKEFKNVTIDTKNLLKAELEGKDKEKADAFKNEVLEGEKSVTSDNLSEEDKKKIEIESIVDEKIKESQGFYDKIFKDLAFVFPLTGIYSVILILHTAFLQIFTEPIKNNQCVFELSILIMAFITLIFILYLLFRKRSINTVFNYALILTLFSIICCVLGEIEMVFTQKY